jgi:D-amino-acid oxidase
VTSTHPDVLVVGAGVSGLTTGICLAEAGLRVLIRAARPPRDTTSAVAGAVWGPHLVEAGDRARRWGSETLAELRRLAADPATGVRIGTGVQAARSKDGLDELPDALAGQAGARACAPGELPPGFAAGWRYSAPLAWMPAYLDYLAARFARAGGELTAGTVSSLAGAASDAGAPVVINCAGIGASELAGDPALTPVRGQVVVAANPGLTEFFIGLGDETAELTYLFPHGDVVLLGGTTAAGDWSLDPDPAVADRIMRDCAAAEPRLRGAAVLGHLVGLRPARPTVRLEAEQGPAEAGQASGGPLVLHNYGHGGAGITLSWGCAREAAALALAARG